MHVRMCLCICVRINKHTQIIQIPHEYKTSRKIWYRTDIDYLHRGFFLADRPVEKH